MNNSWKMYEKKLHLPAGFLDLISSPWALVIGSTLGIVKIMSVTQKNERI